VLVTGLVVKDATPDMIPDLNHPHLAHWFAQNFDGPSHAKITPLPLGINYHTLSQTKTYWGPQATPLEQEADLLARISNIKSAPCTAAMRIPYSDTAFERKETRKQVYEKVQPQVTSLSERVNRNALWDTYAMHSFIVSPHGRGLDCHRTWEILALGRIPIVRTSSLDPLYDGLPVMILDKYEDLNQELMVNFKKHAEKKWDTYNWDKLTMAYWDTLIHRPWEANK